MQKVFLISILITFLFCVFKFLEMKYLENELKPLKFFVRDAIIVFTSAVLSTYICFHLDSSITDFFNVITESKSINMSSTEIFTDSPGF